MDSKNFDLQKFISVAASLTASSMLLRSIVQDFIPHEIQNFFFSGFSRRFSSEVTIVIEEQQGHLTNELFEAVEFYLATKLNNSSLKRVKVGKTYILDRAKTIKVESKAIKLHTTQYGCSWQSNPINLNHPMNFKTLLYGPPGTGKSSLIASMANYLNYDIYDLDLTDVRGNNGLRTLLLGMSNRSILVIEDIDCSIKLKL